ncbi:MAG: arylesterase [Verrucomicrobiota bacterium]
MFAFALRHGFVGLLIACATLASSPASESKPERKTIVVLGDSITAGFGLDRSEAYPALLQKRVDAAGLSFEVVNAGVSGDTTASGLRRIDWLMKRRMDVLVVELGGNDGLRGIMPETTKANLTGIIRKAREKNPAMKIVLAGMQMPPNMGEEYGEKFRKVFPEVAKECNVALIPFVLEGVGGVPELNQPDGVHPTAKGQEIVAENVWKVLKPVLNSSSQKANNALILPQL